jgi:hypothetical protein
MFGCRHRHLSRVFTIKQRTYRVCFDCGREFDLPAAHAPKPLNSPPCQLNPINLLIVPRPRFSLVSYLAQTRNSGPVILVVLTLSSSSGF